MVAKLAKRLRDKDMDIEITPAAKKLLSEKGYDPVLGARPLRRAIQRDIEDALSEKILFGELKAGQMVIVDAEGEGLLGEFIFRGVPRGAYTSEPVAVGASLRHAGLGHRPARGGSGHQRRRHGHPAPGGLTRTHARTGRTPRSPRGPGRRRVRTVRCGGCARRAASAAVAGWAACLDADACPVPRPRSRGSTRGRSLRLVDALVGWPELHSLMVVRHGSVVAEGWAAPYAPDRLHELFSLSKSFTSTAVGFAVAEGLFDGRRPGAGPLRRRGTGRRRTRTCGGCGCGTC